MAKGKSTKGQTTIYKTYTYNTNTTKNREWTQVLRKESLNGDGQQFHQNPQNKQLFFKSC